MIVLMPPTLVPVNIIIVVGMYNHTHRYMYIIEECYVDEESDKSSERSGRSSSPTPTDRSTLTIYTYTPYVGFNKLVTTNVYERIDV